MTTKLTAQPVLEPQKVPTANEGHVHPLSADERLMMKAVAMQLKAQLAEVHGKVESGSKADAVPKSTKAWDAAMLKAVRPVWFGLFKKGGDKALTQIRKFPKHANKMAVLSWAEMGASVPVDVKEETGITYKATLPTSVIIPPWIEDPEVLEALEAEMFEFAQGIDQTTADMLRETLIQGMEEGDTISKLANSISELSDEWVEGWRSEMIARTETARAYTTGHIEAWRSTGVVNRKVWVAAGDACPFCQEMDGTVVELDENFFDEGDTQTADWKDQKIEMSHDYSDVNGPPLHPNCRCVLIAELDEEKSVKGGAGSGNFGHAGRPGEVGGSGEGGGKELTAPSGIPYKGNEGAKTLERAFHGDTRTPEQTAALVKEREEAFNEKQKLHRDIDDLHFTMAHIEGGLTNEQAHDFAVKETQLDNKVQENQVRWLAAIAELNGESFSAESAKDQSVRDVTAHLPKGVDLSALREYNQSDRYAEANAINTEGKLTDPDKGAQFNHQVVDTAIDQWSASSADTSVRSLEMQMAVAREFKLGNEDRIKGRLEKALVGSNNRTNAHMIAEEVGVPAHLDIEHADYELHPAKSNDRIAALQVVARAMYDNTQEQLKAAGVEEVTLWRGSSVLEGVYPELIEQTGPNAGARGAIGREVSVRGNAASSWSTKEDVARSFHGEATSDAGGKRTPVIYRAVAPRSAIFSTAVTGIGCLDEKEVVVLGVGGKAHAWRSR